MTARYTPLAGNRAPWGTITTSDALGQSRNLALSTATGTIPLADGMLYRMRSVILGRDQAGVEYCHEEQIATYRRQGGVSTLVTVPPTEAHYVSTDAVLRGVLALSGDAAVASVTGKAGVVIVWSGVVEWLGVA